MKKDKILIVHNYYQIPGGEDAVVQNEMKMLLENGHEVVLYTKNNKDANINGITNKLKCFINSIFSYKSYKEISNIIVKEKIDIVHVHNTLLLISPSVYYAAINNKVPIVQTLHNFRFICPGATLTKYNQVCKLCLEKGLRYSIANKCYRNSFVQTLIIYLMIKIHRLLGTYKKVNAYIALTEFNKNLFTKYNKQMRNLFIKPNFASNYLENSEENIINRNIEEYFVYLGRLDEIKGIKDLLLYWQGYKKTRLLIIGSGPEEHYVTKFIKDNNLSNVEYLGFKVRNEALNILKHSKALIIPSLCYEGFPMTIVEAFSLGVPVIGSRLGNIANILQQDYNGCLFQPGDDCEFLSVISKIDNDLEYNRMLGRGAYETFISKYSETINYERLIEIYEFAKDDYYGKM